MSGVSIPVVEVSAVPENGYLLDVREEDEWRAGHAPNAVHIPLGQLAERAAEIPKDTQVYVLCRVGGRSARAVQALNEAGWRAANVAGGMSAWALARRPMVSETGEPPVVL
ncbi:rhodanese-like domain-containing protein [Thermobifida fusca]|uniref:Rhodanese-like protein n=2 Tax=Thermobifida fusca TaxID=2021 RepID=A0A9P2TDK8_THEFU|nr:MULTISPECIES: rhodanese-like domain-containing protein [Thermobifida]AAZ57091.1 rhodanese-like [Thermobifida fusca YX]EOR72803.1 rhodanese-like protein [Thermobifida fusca TM51]MBO2530138.1 rhodanese-like domain-containing protein [Thermobifida sp.]MDD6790538.1 rhodanese-like domain-containing protein [Thermobifida fusca]PPS95015.1 sulfurtransferase [Thermobifida fusca]